MYKTRGNNVRQGCDRLRRQGVSEHIQLLVLQECILYRIEDKAQHFQKCGVLLSCETDSTLTSAQ